MSKLKFATAASAGVLMSMLSFSAAAQMTISGTFPATATVGKKYDFVPVAHNANVATLEFSYLNLPSWSKHYRSSGAIIGTPTTPGVYSKIQIQAWDGEHFAETAPFTITVRAAASTAPPAQTLQISGTPASTATVGKFYSFTPTVVATAGSSLTYKVSNKPSWAQFSSTTGSLVGTPSAANVATDSDIVVGVSSGAVSASLPAFDIRVDPVPSANAPDAIVSWSKPAQNTNGTPFTNLAGYIVRYGTNLKALTTQIPVASPNTTALEIRKLSPGNWYFEVAAVNTANIESQFSATVSDAIP
jgi:hypothetical protein